jgi:hypothetical protein
MNKPKNFLYLLILLPFLLLASFTRDPGVLQAILKKMQAYQTEHPQEKLYLHFDKPFYAAGENVWFKAYLVEASLHTPDSLSRVVYVEVVDSAKNILQRKVLYAADGVTFGDFQLSDSLKQGKYLFRAYTNYMKNVGEDFFFMREFSILSGSESDKIVENTPQFNPDLIALQFFPEGGNLVACGTFNRLAFKTLSPDGKGIAVEGEIVDETNTVVASFQTQHEGMGIVRLNPATGKTYSARITKPYTVKRLYPLPRLNAKGYLLQVDEIGKNIKVVVFTNEDKPASGKLDISIVAQSRGKVYHAQTGVITTNAFFTYIPRSKFPEGITQITLFDPQGKPVAERLIHQDQKETVSIALKTDQQTFGRRSLVAVYADALYANGGPAIGNFSISVYDDGILQSPEKYPLTITNYLSLTSDLKGYIENPGYYFKDSLPDTKKHLDLLMMVHGWRRFTWKDVLEDNRKPQQYNHEQGIPISGQVLKAGGKKAPTGSTVKIMTMTGNAIVVKPDSLGRFYSDGLLYYDSMDLVIQTENEKGKKQPFKFVLNPFSIPPQPTYSVTAFSPFDASQYLQQQSEEKAIYKTSEVTVLKEVVVEEKKERDPRLVGFRTDEVINVSKLGTGYANIFQMIQSQVAGVMVNGNNVTIRGKEPAYLLNGTLSTVEMVAMMSPTDVEKIEIIKSGAVMYGANSVINIILKAGAWDREPIGIDKARYPGFYQAREFYSPRYDVPDDRHNLPDQRSTLFWEPIVITDEEGRAAVAFYTSDVPSRYRIIMEGITRDGYPGTATLTFDVQ